MPWPNPLISVRLTIKRNGVIEVLLHVHVGTSWQPGLKMLGNTCRPVM
jgi:hypothetical protein